MNNSQSEKITFESSIKKYFQLIKEQPLLWKILVVFFSLVLSITKYIPALVLNLSLLGASVCVLFATLCSSALFLPYKSPLKSVHFEARMLFIIVYMMVINKVFISDSDTYLSLFNDHTLSRFVFYWGRQWILISLLFGLIIILNNVLGDKFSKVNSIRKFFYSMISFLSPLTKINANRKKKLTIPQIIISLVFIITLSFLSASGYIRLHFPSTDIESVLFTIKFSQNNYSSDVRNAILIIAAIIIALTIIFYLRMNRLSNSDQVVKYSPYKGFQEEYEAKVYTKSATIFTLIALLFGTVSLMNSLNLPDYINRQISSSTIYETYYVDPSNDVITFPEKKKNLIYMFLESYECTYTSIAHGGNQDVDLMPELYQLAEDNLYFSHNNGFGGQTITCARLGYTMGSTVANTSGVTLASVMDISKNGYDQLNSLLPSLRRMEDVMHDAGYNQMVIQGSSAEFAGLNKYVGRYNNSTIYDLDAAEADGIDCKTNSNEWGINDIQTLEIAKDKITELSEKEEPFYTTIFTIDTHTYEGGFRCKECDPEIEDTFQAAVRCTSKQVSKFIDWLKQQPYWDDTVVILVGDHVGMSPVASIRLEDDNYERATYNCFINSQKTPVNTHNRLFCACDMFPTSLSAIGCNVKGDRLGLGTDLFSGTPTLCEEMGSVEFKVELQKNSKYYNNNFWDSN